MKKIILFLIIICNSFYLTEIVDLYTLQSVLQYALVFSYFVVVQFFGYYLIKKINNGHAPLLNRKRIIFSVIISLLIIGAGGEILKDQESQSSLVTITASGEKNPLSNSSEVWITGVVVDGLEMDLSEVNRPNSWELREGSLISFTDQPASLQIPFQRSEKIEILFLKHPWSGQVNIQENSVSEKVDLYSTEASSYSYEVKGNILRISSVEILLYHFAAFVFFISLTLALLNLGNYKNKLYCLFFAYLYWIVFILTGSLSVNKIMDGFLILISIVCGITFMKTIQSGDFSKYFSNTTQKMFFVVITCYSSFAILNNKLFVDSNVFYFDIKNISVFFLFCLWLIPFEISFIRFVDRLHQKNILHKDRSFTSNKLFLWIQLFALMMVVWGLYLIAFNPANISPDSISQWKEALGIEQLSDWHPAFHTLVIKMIVSIYPSPVSVALFQMCFAAAVISSFLVLLVNCGMPKKWAFIGAFLFAVVPNNGSNIVTLWKDIPYTISLLWLTLVFARLVVRKNNFSANILNLISLTGALSCVYLFRHNGVIPFVMAIIALFIWVILKKDYKIIISLVVAVILVAGIKGPIYSAYKVIPNPAGVQYSAPVHGIASVIYHDGDLSSITSNFMEDIMPLEEWKRLYTPYSADPYIFDNQYEYINKLSQKSTKEILSMYLSTLVKNPMVVISDRLAGLNLIWDVTQPADAYNNKYSNGVYENDMGLVRHPNSLTSFFTAILDRASQNDMLNIIFWRGGLYMILFLLLIYYCFIRKMNNMYLVFLPLVANVLSLSVSMAWQDYRYIYFEFFIFFFLLGFIIYNNDQTAENA
ncbi:DUF6020 family protein [Paenibacillus sp. MMS20-IR301]|uniref:DUF6020 family protein n=1 Tax=Paenibacillus sp. MMS20-IR301 TaxID=2895946 RepID=UPI0028F05082|nr:DUF6020 family protein [Paenibacillus sp. MMS20-IR301]WNS42738.1 DUF6020 family protein [Paenibacillus sp. MMS20-IR301]